MKKYDLTVNLNEGKRFATKEEVVVGTVVAPNKEAAEEAWKKEMYGQDCGVEFLRDPNQFLGMQVRAICK